VCGLDLTGLGCLPMTAPFEHHKQAVDLLKVGYWVFYRLVIRFMKILVSLRYSFDENQGLKHGDSAKY
jgi:hypothetical protein